MIAMAIACEPKLLIADEPTTALDVTIQRQILELIASAAGQAPDERAVHQPRSRRVGEIADHVVVMRNGDDPRAGPGRRRSSRAPQDAYTKALLPCRPRLDGSRCACR